MLQRPGLNSAQPSLPFKEKSSTKSAERGAREVIISISEIKLTNQRNVLEGLYLNLLHDQHVPGADDNESRCVFKEA